jgi:hypothetical protein
MALKNIQKIADDMLLLLVDIFPSIFIFIS